MRQENLKGKKVERKRMNFGQSSLLIAGILCIVYFIVIMAYAGWTSLFHVIWLFMGIGFLVIQHLWHRGIVLPMNIKVSLLILVVAGCVLFLAVLLSVIKGANERPKPDAKYMLILGAQVNGRKVSRSLRQRLDAAIPYLMDNPDTIVIVSGGKGSGEDVTEAFAMSEYLKKKGIAESRICSEEKATNTNENIMYSAKFMTSKDASCVVVSNGFHIVRSLKLCKSQNLTNVSGLGSNSVPIMVPTYYTREVLALIKDYLVGNIK